MSAQAPSRPFDEPFDRRPRPRDRTTTVKTGRRLEARFPALIDSVPTARHRVARWLSGARVDPEIRDELALVVTELVTNAIEASPGPGSEVEVSGRFERGQAELDVVLAVRDHGTGFASNGEPKLPAPGSVRGRGLPIVNALMDTLTVAREQDWTVVEVTRSLPLSGR